MSDFTHNLAITIGINNYKIRWSSTRRFIHSPKKISKAHYDRFINSPAWQVITSAAHNQEAFDFIRDNRGIGKDN